MTFIEQLALFSTLDYVAVGLIFAGWLLVGIWIERDSPSNKSVSVMMSKYRRAWMREMVGRENRIFDSQVSASLRQGTAFFASTSALAIGGVIALLGSPDPLVKAAAAIGQVVPEVMWQLKLVLVTTFLTVAFLRFVWANRLFGYSVVLMAAVPNDPNHEDAQPLAKAAAEINIRAAFNFNRGLRSIYFAIASLTWLAGAAPLIIATVLTLWMIWQREFMSISHRVLMDAPKCGE